MKITNDLADRIYKRYPYPKPWWSKVHYEKRCTEIYAAEQALLRCMEATFEDPANIIEGYIFELTVARKNNDNIKVSSSLNIMINTLEELYNYLKVK